MTKSRTEIGPVLIQALSHEGRGIAKINGKTTFITGALPQEHVTFYYTRRHNNYDEAEVASIAQASPNRVEPRCPHTAVCGGCSLQHFAAPAQIAYKQQVLAEQLQHFGQVVPQAWLPPLIGPEFGYRRKARLGVKYVAKKQDLLVGFREKNGRYLADLTQCEILLPQIGHLFADIKQCVRGLEQYAQIAQIEVAIGDDHAALIFRHLAPLGQADQARLQQFGAQHNLHIYTQAGGPETAQLLFPAANAPVLHYQLPEQQLTLTFHPLDFIQVNAGINQAMVTQALALLELAPTDRVLDLFCGLGNFSLALAQRCHSLVGVEGDTLMVERAEANAAHNQISNASFYAADLNSANHAGPWATQTFDKILLDPPRSGALGFIQTYGQFAAVQRIVYISCNPATLARDAGELTQRHGYQLRYAGVMDMFPHTTHVEAIAVFVR